jgi:hypothetical protein
MLEQMNLKINQEDGLIVLLVGELKNLEELALQMTNYLSK